MLLGSATDPNALDRVILMAKSGGGAVDSAPQQPTQQAVAYNQAVYNRPTAMPMAAPGGNVVTVEGQDAENQDDATDDSADASTDDTADDQTDQTDQTDDQAAADDQQQQQDGQQQVKTPEQLLQELQQRQQQMQQQGIQPGVQPGVPPGMRQFPILECQTSRVATRPRLTNPLQNSVFRRKIMLASASVRGTGLAWREYGLFSSALPRLAGEGVKNSDDGAVSG